MADQYRSATRRDYGRPDDSSSYGGTPQGGTSPMPTEVKPAAGQHPITYRGESFSYDTNNSTSVPQQRFPEDDTPRDDPYASMRSGINRVKAGVEEFPILSSIIPDRDSVLVQNSPLKELYGATTIKENPAKLVCYDPDELTGFRAFAHIIGSSIFTSSVVWKNMSLIIGIAIAIAVIAFVMIPDPSQVNLSELNAIAAFFKVFIAFMLGLHVSASYARFQQLLVELTALFGTVKQIQAELLTLNVPEQERKMIERYGLLSCRLFHFELHETFEITKRRRAQWSAKFDELEQRGYLGGFERRELEKNLVTSQCDCSSLCWLWVASLITKLSQEGDVPPMASPTFNCLLDLSKRDALKAIRKGKQALSIQMPFPYAHMLATLVHVNNYVLATICGLQMGTSVGNLYKAIITANYNMLGKPITNIGTQMCVVLMIPFFYQAFLQVACLMCSPVNHKDFPLPVDALINKLERELEAQEEIIINPPHWDAPSYKVRKGNKRYSEANDTSHTH